MDKKVTMQVPMSAQLRKRAEKKAVKEGFSSLQEVVRVMLTNYADDEFSVGMQTELHPDTLRKMEKEDKRIRRLIKEGKTETFKSADDLMQHLKSL